jgi:hypothetical protein
LKCGPDAADGGTPSRVRNRIPFRRIYEGT